MIRFSDIQGAEILDAISKRIHLGEWCPERERCAGTSCSSDLHARAALEVVKASYGTPTADGIEVAERAVAWVREQCDDEIADDLASCLRGPR